MARMPCPSPQGELALMPPAVPPDGGSRDRQQIEKQPGSALLGIPAAAASGLLDGQVLGATFPPPPAG